MPQPTARRSEIKDHRMVITSDALQCVRVPISELRMSKTQETRSRQRSRPVELCTEIHTCTNEDCTFVHPRDAATFESWTFRQVHANLQVKTADDENVRYPRCTGSGSVTTLCPNTKAVVDQDVPIEHLLLTLGTKDVRDGHSVVHCAHYYFEQACNKGARCHFAHVLTVRPKLTVTPNRLQWASKKIVESDRRSTANLATNGPSATDQAMDSKSEHWRVYDAGCPADSVPTTPATAPCTVWTTDSSAGLACVQVPKEYDPPNNPRPACDNVQVRVDVGDDGVAHVIVTEVTAKASPPPNPSPPQTAAPMPLVPRVGVIGRPPPRASVPAADTDIKVRPCINGAPRPVSPV